MKTYLTICLILLSTGVHAAPCDKIDYVEVKDWPVAKVEQAYCDAHAERLHVAFAGIGLHGPAADEHDVAIAACESQMALYVRVLENIHKRRIPSCSK
jgi:hypothetical protein